MGNYDDFTKYDLRISIAREVGANERTHHTPMQKRTLNMLHAYLTGEFAFVPGRIFEEAAPDRDEIALDIAMDVGLGSYIELYTENEEKGVGLPTFRHGDLVSIREEMEERGDQRSWV